MQPPADSTLTNPMTKKRVRTGCLRCRTRRRKCDEGKPRCQRCINGDFECRYGTRLSFLPKNSLSIQQEPQSKTPSSYGNIQFVLPKSSSRRKTREPPPQQDRNPKPNDGSDDVPGNGSPDPSGSSLHLQLIDTGQLPHPPALQQDPSDSPSGETINGRYNDALDALLSLRAEETPMLLGLPSDNLFQVPDTPGVEHGLDDLVLTSKTPTDSLACGGLSEEQVLALLRHWRYEVAPWIDICDLGQGFGIFVSRLATFARPILEAVLSLSIASLPHTSETTHPVSLVARGISQNLDMQSTGTDLIDSSPQVNFLRSILVQARTLFVTRQNDDNSALLAQQHFTSQTEVEPTTAIGVLGCHLQLRLELSRALLDERVLPAIPPLLDFCPTGWHKTQLARDMFLCATNPLVHCAKAAQFCYAQTATAGVAHGDRAARWVALIEDLDSWYSGRPNEFHSIFEADNSDDGIPSVLFTSGAATFANQLYHTAMLLLLLHKPRTAEVPKRHRVSAISPLWHVRRICGISLNNDFRSNWDPTLLASFIVAAKRMTHESQHQTIFQGLDRITKITGWDTSAGKLMLQSEWGSLPG